MGAMPRVRSRRRRLWRALAALGVAFLGLNALALFHARAMTRYADSGGRTPAPGQLGGLEKLAVLLGGVNVPRARNDRTPDALGLAYEVHRYRSPRGEIESWLVPREGAVLVLLFPGYAASKASLLELAVRIHALGASMLLVDFCGVGGSSGSTTTIGWDEAADVAASLAWARERFPERALVLYGVSMGAAAVARAVAVEGARPDGIVLEAIFDRLSNSVRARFALMGVPSFPCAELLVLWGGWLHGFDGFEHAPVEYARAVQCPTLVLHGGRDGRAPIERAREVFDGLPGWKRFEAFPGGRHCSLPDADRVRWVSGLSALFSEIRARRDPSEGASSRGQ